MPANPISSSAPVCYGMRIRLRHVFTGAFLKAVTQKYSHEKSSKQPIIGAVQTPDSDVLWLVKGRTNEVPTFRQGQVVKKGDVIRLEHVTTGFNLHSHAAPAAITKGENEVTGFTNGGSGNGDPNDDWTLEPNVGESWLEGEPVRLVHFNTRRMFDNVL